MKEWKEPKMLDLDTKCTADIMPLSGTDTPSQMVTCPGCGKSILKIDFHNPANHNSALNGGGACPYKKDCPADCPVHH